MSDIAISIKNVSKYYKLYDSPKDRLKEALNFSGKIYHKKYYATKNMDLEIKKGEILGVVGKNGSGKSTLLKLITGVLTPDEGSIEVKGKISALLELGSGFNPEFTGMQNIFFYGTIAGFTKKQMEEKLDDILAFADIGDFIHQPLKSYSSGMKSRLGFAVAVHIDPEILILDEVLAVGDVLFKRKCYAKMEEFFKGGKTILFVSHDANSVKELCSRAIFLDEGNIILDSDPKTVTTYYEKYLFSNDKEMQKLKDEITNISNNKNIPKEKCSKDILQKKETETSLHTNHTNIDISDEYSTELKSTPIVFNNHIAYYHNIHIKNDQNKIVNNLTTNNTYKIMFDITFLENIINASIGIQILTLKGVLISGVNMKDYTKKTINNIDTDDTYTFEIEFNCFLLPGMYIIKLFMTSDNTSEVRMEDALLFKVKDNIVKEGGYVTLHQTITYTKKKDENKNDLSE